MTMPQQIIKEAGVLRKRLQSGLINTNELVSFLIRVESVSPPTDRVKVRANKRNERFQAALASLDRTSSRKG